VRFLDPQLDRRCGGLARLLTEQVTFESWRSFWVGECGSVADLYEESLVGWWNR
jgi:hypothetical protein